MHGIRSRGLTADLPPMAVENKRLRAERDDLRVQVEHGKTDYALLKDDYMNICTRIEKLEQTLGKANANISGLEQSLDAKHSENTVLRARVGELEAELLQHAIGDWCDEQGALLELHEGLMAAESAALEEVARLQDRVGEFEALLDKDETP